MDGPNPWPTLLYRRSDGLEFTTGQSPWPGAQQWSFPTITVEDELISTLPLSTHSAVEMLHDSALYKFMLDIDIDILYGIIIRSTVNFICFYCLYMSLLPVGVIHLSVFRLFQAGYYEDFCTWKSPLKYTCLIESPVLCQCQCQCQS